MSLWHIAWSYLWSRKFTTILTIMSVALAVALITALLTVRDETRKRFEEEQAAFDMVIGTGSPLTLVLNAVYFLDQPTGRISYDDYLRVKNHEDVAHAFPVLLGDTYNQHRIVGTDRALFDYDWESMTGEKRSPFNIAAGAFFDRPMQAVLGAEAAKSTGLEVGDEFEGIHGTYDMGSFSQYDHSDHPYTVVGVLKPSGTSNDRAIFVDMQSVWDMHAEEDDEAAHDEDEEDHGDDGAAHDSDAGHAEHAEEGLDEHGDDAHPGETADEHAAHANLKVSAVLVALESTGYRFTFKGWVMDDLKLTGASPYDEILDLFNTVLQPAVIVLFAVGYVVVVISALSIMIGLYLSIIQRKRDLAIMRALGAAASEIFGAVIIEAFLVTVIGIAAGWVLGKGVAFGVGVYLSRSYGLGVGTLSTSPEEWRFFAVVAIIGLLAGIVPAWQAYQTDIAKDLSAN